MRVRGEASIMAKSKEVLELRRIEIERVKVDKWDGKLPHNIYAGAPIPYFNVPEAKPDVN